jgi:hypothetical protein
MVAEPQTISSDAASPSRVQEDGMAELDPHPAPAVDPTLARMAWRTAEPIHGMIYFAPEAHERYAALGLRERMGYFASRAAAFGPVGPGGVAA